MVKTERLFSTQPLRNAPGVFDPGGAGFAEGASQATRQIRGASRRAFASQQAAIDRRTQALIDRGKATAHLGSAIARAGDDIVGIGVELKRREDEAARELEFSTARVDIRRGLRLAHQKAVDGAGPDANGARKDFDKDITKLRTDIVENIKDEEVRRKISAFFEENLIIEEGRLETSISKRQLGHNLSKLQENEGKRLAEAAEAQSGIERNNIMQEQFAEYRRQAELGTISETEAQLRMKAFRTAARRRTIKRDIQADPIAARKTLDAGGYDDLLVDNHERDEVTAQIENEVIRFDRKKSIEKATDYENRISDFELTDPDREQIDTAYNSGRGWLQIGDRNRLLKKAAERFRHLETLIDSVNLVSDALSGKRLLDPRNEVHRNAVDQYYRIANSNLRNDPDGPLRLANFVARVGMLPSMLSAQVRSIVRGGTAEEKVRAAQFMALARHQNAAVVEEFDGNNRRFLVYLEQLTAAGMDPSVAVEQTEEAVFEADDIARRARLQEIKDENHANAFPVWIWLEFDRFSSRMPLNPRFANAAGIPDELLGEFGVVYAEHYERTGDKEVARTLALQDVKKVWGVTNIGRKRLIKYAPEVIYNKPGKDSEWIEEQLIQEISKNPLLVNSVRGRLWLEADTLSSLEWDPTTGKPWPSYIVYLKDTETGAFVRLRKEDGSLLRWRPDFETSPARARELEEERREEEIRREEKIRRNQKRDLNKKKMLKHRDFYVRRSLEIDEYMKNREKFLSGSGVSEKEKEKIRENIKKNRTDKINEYEARRRREMGKL